MVVPFVLLGAPLWLWLTLPRARARRAGIFLACCLLVILPWTARDWLRTGDVVLISTQGAADVWLYNTLALNPPLTEPQARAALRRLGKKKTSALQMQMLWLERATQTPFQWLVAKTREAAQVWSDPMSNWAWYGVSLKMFQANAPVETYLRALHIFLFGSALLGLIWSPEPAVTLLTLFFLAAALGIFFITHYMPRFRVGLQPILLPMTAFGMLTGLEILRAPTRERSRVRVTLSLALLWLYVLALVTP